MAPNKPDENRRSVGVYDRPASADRPRSRLIGVVLIALALAAGGIYFFWLT